MGIFETITAWDISVLNFIREHLTCGFLDVFMPIVTFLGNAGWFWILCAVVMLFFKKTRKTGWMVGAALIFGLILCNLVLKNAVARIRPFDLEIEAVKGIKETLLISKPTDWSFPSGHTTASFEAATVLMIRDKRLGIPALVLASIIAFSRLYLYVHYPTDILGGIIVGVICAVLGWLTVKFVYKKMFKEKA